MGILEAIILGIVQGLSEFLPISSSGHLIVVQNMFSQGAPAQSSNTFIILLHVATLIPVLFIYRDEIISLLKNPFQKLTLLLILATIPATLVALFFGDFIDSLFTGGIFLPFCFIITGFLLIYADSLKSGNRDLTKMTKRDAVIVGCIQAIAILPGISRSGSTITASLACGLKKETAAKFSFLLSIPAICGALVLELKDIITGEVVLGHIDVVPVVFGFIAAMLTGYLAITFMIKLIQNSKLKYFSWYLFVLSGVLLAFHVFNK